MPNILIVDDEENIRKVLKGLLAKNGFDVVMQAENGKKEAGLIRDALKKTGNNKTKAAEELGISRRTLLYRIKEYGI